MKNILIKYIQLKKELNTKNNYEHNLKIKNIIKVELKKHK